MRRALSEVPRCVSSRTNGRKVLGYWTMIPGTINSQGRMEMSETVSRDGSLQLLLGHVESVLVCKRARERRELVKRVFVKGRPEAVGQGKTLPLLCERTVPRVASYVSFDYIFQEQNLLIAKRQGCTKTKIFHRSRSFSIVLDRSRFRLTYRILKAESVKSRYYVPGIRIKYDCTEVRYSIRRGISTHPFQRSSLESTHELIRTMCSLRLGHLRLCLMT
ncbi:unnamed protein product [Xylocopa violacea]|uniref:Ribosomal protein S4 n=1 Tax=Xylocopa violacea TaxID=135666 RepID=A0ABP1NWU2_XYLVO